MWEIGEIFFFKGRGPNDAAAGGELPPGPEGLGGAAAAVQGRPTGQARAHNDFENTKFKLMVLNSNCRQAAAAAAQAAQESSSSSSAAAAERGGDANAGVEESQQQQQQQS